MAVTLFSLRSVFIWGFALSAGQALADPLIETNYNSYGSPGLIDMPSAHSRPDAELAFTVSSFKNTRRSTLTFQMTPRFSGSFRYSNLYNIRGGTDPGSAINEFIFDRSFSVHYRFVDENHKWPAIAVGLNDFFGTGIYQSEYFVATKTFGSRFRATGGIGWGRLAGVGNFKNPLGYIHDGFFTRPGRQGAQGGTLEAQNWFRGDAALFGGMQYQANPKLLLTAEYSSDAYPQEDGASFDRKTPFNFGVTYKFRPNVRLSANYLYGSELGVQLSMALNPKNPPAFGGFGAAPPSIVLRGPKTAEQLGWDLPPERKPQVQSALASALIAQDLELQSFEVSGTTVHVAYVGTSSVQSAQDLGRVARILTSVLPTSIETFVLIPVVNGVRTSQITLQRSDLERFEYGFDGAWNSYAAALIEPAFDPVAPIAGFYPRFKPQIGAYLKPSFFDPEYPLLLDIGVEARATYEPVQGVVFRGAVRKKVIGNLNKSDRVSDSVLPKVRSETNIYDREGDPALPELTVSAYTQFTPDLYGRATFGYLEPQFGGLSTELLWKPIESRFAIGAELNYVQQRDYDQRFGFRDYSVLTGHVSGYWQLANGYHAQVDVGRYLAEDLGATFTLDREFKNGWKVGAFFTLTDVSAEDFGEGSFDKGLRFSIPINWISGEPDRQQFATTIRPVVRDGGARVEMAGRLYETVRGTHRAGLRDGWGRFWR